MATETFDKTIWIDEKAAEIIANELEKPPKPYVSKINAEEVERNTKEWLERFVSKTKIYSYEEIKNILFPVFAGNAVHKAVLFGSYAKGQATAKSDIDIVVDSKGELLNISFYGLLEEITEKLKKNIDLFEISEIKENSPIHEAIKNEGLVLYAK